MNYYFNTSLSIFLTAASAADLRAVGGIIPIEPSYTSGFDEDVRLNTVQYGNGYKQDSPDGINYLIKSGTLEFTNRRARIIQELVAFFRGAGSYSARTPADYFFWQLPVTYNDTTIYKFKCAKWSVKWTSTDIGTLTAAFTQTFEP